jgi:ABC-2 type transport system permease protein
MTALPAAAGPEVSTTIVPSARPPGAGATIMAVATRTVRKYLRTPQLLVFGIVTMATFLVLFRYIFGGAIHFPSVSYADFLVPGFVLAGVLITGTTVAAGVAEDVEQGFFDRLRSLPVPRTALAAGRVLGDTVVIAWSTAVTAAMGFAVGFRLHGSLGQAVLAYALCLACGFAFGWMFVWMGLVAGNAQSAQGMSMIIYPFMFVSSAYVQVGTLPGWMQPVAEHQPITIMSNAVRSLALGSSTLAAPGHTTAYWVVLSLVWAAGIVAVFAPLAALRYRRSG